MFLGPKPHGPSWSVWDAIGDLPPLGPGEEASEYLGAAQNAYQSRAREASGGLQGHRSSDHPPGLVKAISYIPDGGDRRAIPDDLQPRSGCHNSYSRLDSREPAVAITSNMGKPSASRCIHPFQHRGLTAREGARLQGFPDRFHFTGGMVAQRQQVANAVPPPLAAAVGRALLDPARWAA
jgi:DNA (cytosine-5)-methyltransferase 1